MTNSPGAVVMRPIRGTRRFRRRASVVLADGVITATDRRGRTARFPLDGTDEAPTRRGFETYPEAVWLLLDGRDQGLVKGVGIEWDHIEEERLCAAGGLGLRAFRRSPPMRADGMVLEDATWPWAFIHRLWPVGLISASLGKLEIVPPALAAVVGSLAVLGIIVAFASGVNAPPRPAEGVLLDRQKLTKSQARREAKLARAEQNRRRARRRNRWWRIT